MTIKQFMGLMEEVKAPLAPGIDMGREAGIGADIIHRNTNPIITKLQAICLVKWQCASLFGGWDLEAVNETKAWFLRKKVQVIN